MSASVHPPRDAFGAFVPGPRLHRPPTGDGPLRGLSFAVKDSIDIAGARTGFGNPDWLATHAEAESSAWVVDRVLAAGGRVVGRTICDELTFSLEGANPHYGTPRNPRCPSRLPGGSSSGSVVAVAAGLADCALGTDTGGSVRVPASFCGVLGFRPTHGRIPVRGVLPLAPSYDTVGWFARDGRTLERVGKALLPRAGTSSPPRRLLGAADALALVEPRCLPALEAAAGHLGVHDQVALLDGHPEAWVEAYLRIQGAEIWAEHGVWLRTTRPRLGPRTAERLAATQRIAAPQLRAARRFRARAARTLRRLLSYGTALVVPAAPSIALSRRRTLRARAEFYRRALALTSLAGHAGLPQLVVPAGVVAGAPIGIGIIGAAGADAGLLALAARTDGWGATRAVAA